MENDLNAAPLGTFLRWAGSKRQLIPALRQYYPVGARYVEPFAGSACLFFALSPEEAILGDLNEELMNTLQMVKRLPTKLAARLMRMSRSRTTYLRFRALDVKKLKGLDRAVRFIYLNRYCFNGLYRTNLRGEFNVPFGAFGTGKLPGKHHLLVCSRALRRAKLVHGDFEHVLSNVVAGDFVYMDPPYAVSARRIFGEYHPDSFSDKDIRRLRKWMLKLDRVGARFVVSYAKSKESRFLSDGFKVKLINVRRNMAGFTLRRRNSQEVLISNF